MNNITRLTDSLIAVKVPEGAFNYGIGITGINEPALCYMEVFDNDPEPCISGELLPPGQWQLLGRPSEISEEVAKEIVEDYPYRESKGTSIWYPAYDSEKIKIGEKSMWNEMFKTALESFHSLLAANKVEGDGWVIVKLIGE